MRRPSRRFKESPVSVNILQVIPELDAGGAERTTLEIAEAVIGAGGRAVVVSEGGRLEGELEAMGAELVRLPAKSKNPITIWRNAARIADLVAYEDIDLIHARSRAPAWSAYLAARRTGTPFVTTYHGTYNARSGLKRWYNSVMARGEVVIANSQFTADHVLREHAAQSPKIEIIPRGVDLDRFDPKRVDLARTLALRESWQVPEGAPLLLLPARLTRLKGHILAIEALAAIEPRQPRPVLVFAGDPQGREEYVRELEETARRLGVEIRLAGHVVDMPAAFAASDLVLNPSTTPETFGRTAAEAQAMGVPVIVADHGGAREVVEEGATGWRAAPGDAAALTRAIEAGLALQPDARARMAKAARTRIETRFSKRALQEKTLRVYRDVLDCRP